MAESTQHATERHRLIVEASTSELIGQFDPMRMERVLANLRDNAAKFSPQGGDISVTVSSDADETARWAVISVSDHGMGIPDAEREHIFERFQRGSNVVGQIRGTGLGLAAVRKILEQHGGSISCESQEGKGTTFTIRVPLEAAEAPRDPLTIGSNGSQIQPSPASRARAEITGRASTPANP